MSESIQKLNYWLEKTYGRSFDRPTYRLVRAGDCTEKRLVEYEGRVDGAYVCSKKELETTKKYDYLNDDLYVLETLVETSSSERPLSFEPLWVFYNTDTGVPQYPIRKALEYLVYAHQNRRTRVRTKAELESAREDEEEAYRKEVLDFLNGSISMTSAHLSAGSGIVVPRNYEKLIVLPGE